MAIEISSGGVSKSYRYYPYDAFYVDANGNVNTNGNGQQVKEAWFNGTKYYPETHPVSVYANALEIVSCTNIVSTYPYACSIDCIPYQFTDTGMTRIFLRDDMTSPVIHQDFVSGSTPPIVAYTSSNTPIHYNVSIEPLYPKVDNAYNLVYKAVHKDEYVYFSKTNDNIDAIRNLGYFPTETEIRAVADAMNVDYYCLNPFSTATVYVLNLYETIPNRSTPLHNIAAVLEIPDWQAFRAEWRNRMNEWPERYRNPDRAYLTYYAWDLNGRHLSARQCFMNFADDRQVSANFQNCGGILNKTYINGTYYVSLYSDYDDLHSSYSMTNIPAATYNHEESGIYIREVGALLSSIFGRTIHYVNVVASLNYKRLSYYEPFAYGYGTFE